MASLTMTASFACGSGAVVSRLPSVGQRRPTLIVAKAAQEQAPAAVRDSGESSGRRSVVFAAAAAAACAVAQLGMAVAAEDPKRGTSEAKKRYAPVCVTMPTAKICHK